jgi:hypothetical protein
VDIGRGGPTVAANRRRGKLYSPSAFSFNLGVNPSSDPAIQERFARLGEWITQFQIGGQAYGGWYNPDGDYRLRQFLDRLPERTAVRDILECGCLEGGHTISLSRSFPDATIHAVDVRPENLAKTQLICELTGRTNVRLSQDDFDEPRTVFGRTYDAIFCLGLLYHLRWPDRFLKATCQAAPLLWLWTVYCAEEAVDFKEAEFRGRLYEEPTQHPLSAVRGQSFFPALGSLVEMLWAAGYTKVELVRKEITANGNGPAILLCASRD